MSKYYALIAIMCLLLAGCNQHNADTTQGYIDGQLIYLSSSQSGYLRHLDIYRGNFVKKGQLLFQLDPQPEQSQLQQAQAQLQQAEENLSNDIKGQRSTIIASIIAQQKQAQADLNLSSKTYHRYQQLYRSAVISKQDLDNALADYQAKVQKVQQLKANLAEAELGQRKNLILAQVATVNAAKATLHKAQWMLQQKTQHSPQAGEVYDTYYKVGEYVPAGQSVLSLLTADNNKIVFYVPETQLNKIKLQQQIYFRCDGCKKQSATITYISANAEYTPPIIYSRSARSKLVYRVEADIPYQQALHYHPGQPIDVTF